MLSREIYSLCFSSKWGSQHPYIHRLKLLTYHLFHGKKKKKTPSRKTFITWSTISWSIRSVQLILSTAWSDPLYSIMALPTLISLLNILTTKSPFRRNSPWPFDKAVRKNNNSYMSRMTRRELTGSNTMVTEIYFLCTSCEFIVILTDILNSKLNCVITSDTIC